MQPTLLALESAFRRQHPEIQFSQSLYGSGTGMAGIITGTSTLSLMGRAATANEVMGFEWVHRYKPLGIQIMTGSLAAEGASPALVVLVDRANPVASLSMEQLAMLAGCPGEGGDAHPKLWPSVGATGAWAARRVHVYLYDNETGTGAFLQKALLGSGDRWDWATVKEFRDRTRGDGTVDPAGHQIAEALRKDPSGLAISTSAYASPDLKMLPLSTKSGPRAATRASLVAGTYPLGRPVFVYLDRGPGKPVDPAVAEFVRFILSSQGQSVIDRQGDYLPISSSLAEEQRRKLE